MHHTEHLELPAQTVAERAGDAVIATLQAKGHCAFRVGGCVRDRFLGRPAKDVDVVTDARPERVKALFPRTFAVGEAFGVIIVHAAAGVDVEVATFRAETGYADGRHPDCIVFAGPAEDAARRDFTLNALFYDPCRAVLHDHTGGLADLRAGRLRAVGAPAARFAEDSLRLLRAVRFSAELGFALEPATRAAIPPAAAGLRRISAERVFAELNRMLLGRAPATAFQLLADLGLLDYWLPELLAMRGVAQPPEFHPEGDVWIHTMLLLEMLRAPSPRLAWAALLHDVGKPLTHEFADGRDRFPGHARAGDAAAHAILGRLKASRALADDVAEMVGNHMFFMEVQRMRPAKVRRLLQVENFADQLELHRLDCMASHGFTDNYCFLLDRLAALASEPAVPPPLVSGADVLALGVKPGPLVGRLLRQVQDMQLEGALANREDALAALPRLLAAEASADQGVS